MCYLLGHEYNLITKSIVSEYERGNLILVEKWKSLIIFFFTELEQLLTVMFSSQIANKLKLENSRVTPKKELFLMEFL